MSQPFLALADAAATVAAYTTAVQLGLLDRIDREPADPEELARTCGANERGVRILLAALESAGFIEALPDGRYRPTLAGLAGYHPLLPMWDHLPAAVRTGTPIGDGSFSALLHGFWGDAATRAAAVLPPAHTVLSCGSGLWCIAYATHNPGCHVTTVDDPHTRRAVSRAGLTDRFSYTTGEPHPPGTFDLIMLPHVCNHYPPPECAALLRRLAPTLTPGGTLAVIETLPGASALRELSLYLRTQGGHMHPTTHYPRWLTDAGLHSITTTTHPTDTPLTIITARAPTPIHPSE